MLRPSSRSAPEGRKSLFNRLQAILLEFLLNSLLLGFVGSSFHNIEKTSDFTRKNHLFNVKRVNASFIRNINSLSDL